MISFTPQVVSDTSPILNLAITKYLYLLEDQFKKIYIPNAVLNELRIQEDLSGSTEMKKAIADGWIEVMEVPDRNLVKVLERDLDKGESEAIAMALHLKADWILLDEREARNIAKSLGLNVIGIVGVLLKARNEGKIINLEKVINDLVHIAGFRISPNLIKTILD